MTRLRGPRASSTSASSHVVRYEYRTACGAGLNGEGTCAVNTCPPGEQVYRLWQTEPPPATADGLVCSGNGPPPVAAAPPQVTPGMVAAAFRRIPLPSLRSHSQPANKTLINFDTIFFTQAQPLTRNLTLLGQRVRLEIRPSRFEWVHGDGTTETTSYAGGAVPGQGHRLPLRGRPSDGAAPGGGDVERGVLAQRRTAATGERHRHHDRSGHAPADRGGQSGSVRERSLGARFRRCSPPPPS